jgi:hypothetical protein
MRTEVLELLLKTLDALPTLLLELFFFLRLKVVFKLLDVFASRSLGQNFALSLLVLRSSGFYYEVIRFESPSTHREARLLFVVVVPGGASRSHMVPPFCCGYLTV